MTEHTIKVAALALLPKLECFYQVRRQARWQQKAAAGADKLAWQAVLIQVDNKIAILEQAVKVALDLDAYRGKKGWSE